jgi:hypothetical protein
VTRDRTGVLNGFPSREWVLPCLATQELKLMQSARSCVSTERLGIELPPTRKPRIVEWVVDNIQQDDGAVHDCIEAPVKCCQI